MMCKPRSDYDEVNKLAIGYKNPLCLHRARQVQPALYSGHVIVTPDHAPAVVRNGEETLELTKISRKKMHDKMKAKECGDNKAAMSTLVGVYGPSKMHFLRYSPFDLVSSGRSFEPAAMILLCIWLSVEDVLTGVDMMNE
ncbi:hypothetical protein Tco_0007884 [Tanacetum coccineum]